MCHVAKKEGSFFVFCTLRDAQKEEEEEEEAHRKKNKKQRDGEEKRKRERFCALSARLIGGTLFFAFSESVRTLGFSLRIFWLVCVLHIRESYR